MDQTQTKMQDGDNQSELAPASTETSFQLTGKVGTGALAAAMAKAGVVGDKQEGGGKGERQGKKRKKLSPEELEAAEKANRAIKMAKYSSSELIRRADHQVVCVDKTTRTLRMVVVTTPGAIDEGDFVDFRADVLDHAKTDGISVLFLLEAVPEQTEEGDKVKMETFHYGCVYIIDESLSGRFLSRGVRMCEISARRKRGWTKCFVPKDVRELDGETVPFDMSTWVVKPEDRKIHTDDQPSVCSPKMLREHITESLEKDQKSLASQPRNPKAKTSSRPHPRHEPKATFVPKEVIRVEPEY